MYIHTDRKIVYRYMYIYANDYKNEHKFITK